MRALWFLFVVAAIARPAIAGPDTWTTTSPGPGAVRVVAVDPSDANVVYAADATNRGAGVFKSTDGGVNWRAINTGLPVGADGARAAVYELAFDPVVPSTVYCLTFHSFTNGAYRSVDAGASWTRVFESVREPVTLEVDAATRSVYIGENFGRLFLSTDGINATQMHILSGTSAITAVSVADGGARILLGNQDGQIHRFANGRWDMVVASGFPIRHIVPDPSTSAVIYAASSNEFGFRPKGMALLVSSDAGAMWSPLPLPSGLMGDISGLLVDGREIYVGTPDGLFRTEDAGTTWTTSALGAVAVTGLAAIDRRREIVYVATRGHGVFRSDTAGATWAARSTGLPGVRVTAIAVNLEDPRVVYAGTDGGVFKSQDGAQTWTPTALRWRVISGLTIDPSRNILYAQLADGSLPGMKKGDVLKSGDGGATWRCVFDAPPSRLADFGTGPVAIDPAAPERVYVFAPVAESGFVTGRLWKSEDGGASWAPRARHGANQLLVSPHDSNVVHTDLAVSSDRGATFQVRFESTGHFALHPEDANILYAAMPARVLPARAGGIYKSTDGGRTWQLLLVSDVPLDASEPGTVAVDPFNPQIVYAGFRRVRRSTDGGATWTDVSAGLAESAYPRRIMVTHRGVYAITASGVAEYTQTTAVQSAPADLVAAVNGSQIALRWSAPPGAGVSGYVLEAGRRSTLSDIARVPIGASTAFTADGVPAGIYYLRVRAITSSGLGPPSNERAVIIVAPTPSAPVGLMASVAGDRVTFTWSAPSGGATLTAYVLEAGSASGAADIAAVPIDGAQTSFAAAGVPPGTYFVRVRARNAVGASAPSNEVRLIVGQGTCPGPPAALVLRHSITLRFTVTLEWSAVAAGPPATGYQIEAGNAAELSNLAAFPTGSTATTYTNNIPPGRYYVRVRAFNACGFGIPSNDELVDVR